jgi:hypothetical protein
MIKWIKCSERLPKHMQSVLVSTSKGQCVCVFIETKAMHETLIKHGVTPEEDTEDYVFASQEIRGMILNKITHWMPLPAAPEKK